jgi:uncharacterized protein (TIGR03089 family)
MRMNGADSLLAAALVRDPAGPLLTYYDDTTAERAELSAATLANWVAKTANLLVDDLGLAPGDRIAVLLPAHWQTAAVLLGGWAAGLVVGDRADGADAAFVTADRAAQALAAGVPEVLALPLSPLGQGFDGAPPDGTRDFPAEVRAQPDRYAGPPPPADAPALAAGEGTVAAGELVEVARRRAAELGLYEGDRLLTVTAWTTPVDWLDNLLVPLAVGATIVLCANADPAGLVARAESERVTASLGLDALGLAIPGARPL